MFKKNFLISIRIIILQYINNNNNNNFIFVRVCVY